MDNKMILMYIIIIV